MEMVEEKMAEKGATALQFFFFFFLFTNISSYLIENLRGSPGINLAYVLEPDVPRFVKGDSLRLQQIVASLLVHCSKLTQSGEISVAVSLAAQPPPPSASPSSSPPGPDLPTPTSTVTTSPSPSAATPSEAMPAQIPTRTSTEALATGTPIELLVPRAPLRVPQSAICPPALTQNILSASLSTEDDAIHDNDDDAPSPPPATTSSAETTPREHSPPPGPQVMLHFEVHSTGMTIDKEEYAQLFKPFGQSDLPNSRKFGAAGLGTCAPFSLSRVCVESHLRKPCHFARFVHL
jgi:signal transduction histidine kinase